MRLWTIHPSLLDAKGLVALWRESLLAKNVLLNNTKGYKNHPQLERFKKTPNPVISINTYLKEIHLEAVQRSYNFDISKIGETDEEIKIEVKSGQIGFEFLHLLKKLKERDIKKHNEIWESGFIPVHPIFDIIQGEKESWEK